MSRPFEAELSSQWGNRWRIGGLTGLLLCFWWAHFAWLQVNLSAALLLLGIVFGGKLLRLERTKNTHGSSQSFAAACLGALCFVVGLWSGLMVLSAFGWVLLAKSVLLAAGFRPRSGWTGFKALGLFSFPWLIHDFQSATWYLQKFSAWGAEHLLTFLGVEVGRSGVLLILDGIEVGVEPGCAGWETLQFFLLIGALFGVAFGASAARTLLNLSAAAAAAVVINVLRISIVTMIGGHFGVRWAAEYGHDLAGNLVMLLLGVSVWFTFVGIRKKLSPSCVAAYE